ncbi:MAG: elongation factor P [Deltaproteobacteria bacterium]|nr:elongation factor P [Deltaproteobacteria bacterium]
MYTTTDFRRGLKIEIDGEPFIMLEFQHVKPGKGGAFVRTKLKSLTSGNVLDRTFKAGDKVDKPDLEEKQMQYLYSQADEYFFMDSSSYDQHLIERQHLGGTEDFLQENLQVTVLFHNGRPLTLELPNFVELEVIKTDPGVKGDTASGGTKPATLETQAIIQVPLFINEGDRIRVDTRTRQYVERAKD